MSDNRALLDAYLQLPPWSAEATALRSGDVRMEYPYAPPGMPAALSGERLISTNRWLERTVTDWKLGPDPVVYATEDPGVFWVWSTDSAKVAWGGTNGIYPGDHVTLFRLRDGKIELVRDYADPLPFYDALGAPLAPFPYSPEPVVSDKLPKPGTSPALALSPDERREKIIQDVLHPNYFEPIDYDLYHDDFFQGVPFIPPMMKRWPTTAEFLTVMQWIEDTLPEWFPTPDPVLYRTTDPDLVIIENGGWGRVQWAEDGTVAGYENDYVILVRVSGGLLREFREYMNPIKKLIAAKIPVPAFPYLV
jgi:ketosteroid isomerase-like protein